MLALLVVQWRMTAILRAKGTSRPVRWLFNAGVIFGYALSFSQVSSFFHVPPKLSTLIGAVSLFYIGVGATAVAVSFLQRVLAPGLKADVDPGRRMVLRSTGNLLMATPFVAVGYGTFVERLNFRVQEVDVPLANLPPELEGLRLVQLSDIHLSPFLSESELARVVDSANGLGAHIAVVTGDLISGRGDPLDACIRQLARLKSDAGIYGCLGNHERHAGAEDYATRHAARAGIRFLRSQTHTLRFGNSVVNLAGVDYQPVSGKSAYLRDAQRLIVPGVANVLLSHNPDVWPVAARQGFDLMLSGHTHGGQITVEILDYSLNPGRFYTPYVYGLFRQGGAAAYVTRGIGTIGIPVRIGAPPEIALLRLRKA